jgi:hypothetical protein
MSVSFPDLSFPIFSRSLFSKVGESSLKILERQLLFTEASIVSLLVNKIGIEQQLLLLSRSIRDRSKPSSPLNSLADFNSASPLSFPRPSSKFFSNRSPRRRTNDRLNVPSWRPKLLQHICDDKSPLTSHPPDVLDLLSLNVCTDRVVVQTQTQQVISRVTSDLGSESSLVAPYVSGTLPFKLFKFKQFTFCTSHSNSLIKTFSCAPYYFACFATETCAGHRNSEKQTQNITRDLCFSLCLDPGICPCV